MGIVTESAKPATRETAAPTIKCVALTKMFGNRCVVDNLSLSVYPGELYALLGDNGAGKTTTINLLTTLLKPTKGEFFICGHNGITESEKTKGAFGIVSQDVAIYSELTAYENLQFVADLYGMPKARTSERIEMLLTRSGLADRANDRAGDFSGGMQRKLTIAISMLHEPKVLFLDEPTVGLDPASRRQIWTELKELRDQGVSILLTTHYLEEAELLADRIGIIRQGKIVVEGTIDELKSKIQGMRGIAIRLAERFEAENLDGRLQAMRAKLSVEVQFDQLRNTIYIAQPKGLSMLECLRQALDWLESENIRFSKFSSSEPNLEEIFLVISGGIADGAITDRIKYNSDDSD